MVVLAFCLAMRVSVPEKIPLNPLMLPCYMYNLSEQKGRNRIIA
jgi:hypothetical protein